MQAGKFAQADVMEANTNDQPALISRCSRDLRLVYFAKYFLRQSLPRPAENQLRIRKDFIRVNRQKLEQQFKQNFNNNVQTETHGFLGTAVGVSGEVNKKLWR